MNTPTVLRPMTVGDILDQSFTIYRQAFVVLVSIVAIIQAPLLLLQIISTLVTGGQTTTISPFTSTRTGELPTFTPAQMAVLIAAVGAAIVFVILAAAASVFQTAALAIVVSEQFLGNTITMRQAYGRALRRWSSLLGAVLLVGLLDFAIFFVFGVVFVVLAVIGGLFSGGNSNVSSALGLVFLCIACIGFPIFFVAYIVVNVRLSFVPQIVVLEQLGAIESLQRSWNLVRGSVWRVIGISILITIMVFIVTAAILAASGIVTALVPWRVVAATINVVLQGGLSILILPIEFAARTLLYYDLRIRKEGFDLQLLAQQLAPTPPPSEAMA